MTPPDPPCPPALSEQPPLDTAMATEQAKLLVKSGAISAIKAENKNCGFKRSRTLEGKLKVGPPGETPRTPLDFWDSPKTPLGTPKTPPGIPQICPGTPSIPSGTPQTPLGHLKPLGGPHEDPQDPP